jgi:hypothetical protein
MTQLSPSRTERVAVEVETGSFIDWPGVVVGMFIAAALSWLLLTFGSAIGLASVSPYTFTQETGTTLTLAAAAWFALTQIYAVAMGAYIAARLRPRMSILETDEVAFRDGVTGLTVWALSIVIGLALAAMIAYGTAQTGAQAVGAAAGTATRAVDPAYTIDRLLRPANPGQAASPEQAQTDDATRQQVGRILANAVVTGDMPASDREYLSQLMASRTGISPADAQTRLNQIYDDAKKTALDAAEAARKTSAAAGFWMAFIMFAAALGAWWAGTVGGHHRDDDQ